MKKVSCATRLRQALALRKMKQSELCEKTKISKSTMSQYINGKYEPNYDRSEAIANVLNVNVAWLKGFDVPMEKPDFSQGHWAGYTYYEQFNTPEGMKQLDEQIKEQGSNLDTLMEFTPDEIEFLSKINQLDGVGRKLIEAQLDALLEVHKDKKNKSDV